MQTGLFGNYIFKADEFELIYEKRSRINGYDVVPNEGLLCLLLLLQNDNYLTYEIRVYDAMSMMRKD